MKGDGSLLKIEAKTLMEAAEATAACLAALLKNRNPQSVLLIRDGDSRASLVLEIALRRYDLSSAGLTLESDASHAWIEAYLPGSGWVGFDPTNGTLVEQTYVKVGHGRDYDDVPPVKGLRRGGGTESLRVAVRVVRVEAPGTAAASTA